MFTKFKLSNFINDTTTEACAGFALEVLGVIRKIALVIADVITTIFSFLYATYDEVNFFSDVDSSSDDKTPKE